MSNVTVPENATRFSASASGRGARWRSLAERLWPEEMAGPSRVWVAPLMLATGLAVSLLRAGWGRPLTSLWAEDGTTFLSQAKTMSPLEAITEPYAGYIHSIPRVIAEVAAAAPLSWADSIFAVSAALVTTALGLVVFRATSGHLRSRWLRYGVTAYFIVPPVGAEVVGVAANIHWFLLPAAFCVAFWTPKTRAGLVIGSVVLLGAATSDPFVLLLLPFLVTRLVATRSVSAWVFTLVLSAGSILQLSGMVGAPDRPIEPGLNPVQAGAWYVGRVVPGAVLGDGLMGGPDDDLMLTSVLQGLVVLIGLAGLATCTLRAPDAHRLGPFAAVCFLSSAGLYGLLVAAAGTATDRYSVPAAMLLILGVAALLDPVVTSGLPVGTWSRATRVLVPVSVVVISFGWLLSVPVPQSRSGRVMYWDSEVADARTRCSFVDQRVLVQLDPSGWSFRLPCSSLFGGIGSRQGTKS